MRCIGWWRGVVCGRRWFVVVVCVVAGVFVCVLFAGLWLMMWQVWWLCSCNEVMGMDVCMVMMGLMCMWFMCAVCL